jgi:transcriptional regulator with XRE-family HTH domain
MDVGEIGGSAMAGSNVLERARREAGLSQQELAERAHTSRTAVSAYEHGRKSPSLGTVERLLAASGYELDVRPRLSWRAVTGRRGKRYPVPDRLPRLPVEQAFGVVRLPLRLNWSEPDRLYRLSDRRDRARVYEAVLREGDGADIERYVDGALLVDQWVDLVLPADLRAAWAPLIEPLLAA